MTPEDIFYREFKGHKNFITPHVIRCGTITGTEKDKKHVVYEVSTGRGINDVKIFGLTILVYDPVTEEIARDGANSGCFHSEEEIETRIKEVRRMYREGETK